MTLYNFIKNINSYSIANQSVKEFNSGDVYEIMNSGVHTYPAIVLTINSVSSEGDNSRVRGVLFYIDRLLSDNSNKDFIQSFGISVLDAIMVESYTKDYLCYENRNYVPFTEKFGDLCAGVYCDFEVLIDGEAVCVDGDFVYKTLLIEQNGTYNPTGYDSVEVNVRSDDMLNYFTLYPSNYIYANYFDPATEIAANVKFTGDEDFYFCSDEKGLVGLYFNAEENETYAWWDSDRVALHFHKSDWEKGYYKIQFKAGRLQIGYLTWTLDSGSSTTSFDPLYFGYYEEKASPMEIEYITISNQYGAAYDYRPKVTEEYAELVEVISGKNADIRTVYSASELSLIEFVKNGGKMAYSVQPDYNYIETTSQYLPANGQYAFYADEVKSYKENLEFYFPNVTNAYNMFARFVQHPVSETAILHMPKMTYGGYCINRTGIAKNLIIETTTAFTNGTNLVQDNDDVVSVEITDCSGVNNTMTAGYCKKLTALKLNNLGKAFTAKRTLSMTHNVSFTKEGLLNLAETLYDISANRYAVGSNILIDASLYNTLTDEDKLKITNKGWALVAQ